MATVLLVAGRGHRGLANPHLGRLATPALPPAADGPGHPPTADDYVPLGSGRIILGWLTLAFLLIGFTPVPIQF